MNNAVFLVKNGIGFGHIRRALLIAEAVRGAGRLRPVVVSQASSLALYRGTHVRVVNFPLLHRVASAVAEDLYTELLNRLLDRLDPAVVIEDTYPDPRYRSLTALADRPRILLMRRLDGLSFDRLRQRGDFAHYDRILIAQDKPAFEREGHSGESLAAVNYGDRCAFVGNVARASSTDEALAARQAYVPDGAPLVVVNGGAGGDQTADGYGDRLFNACQNIAATIANERHPARFVFITGPYYAGRPLADTGNVVVRRFEPGLAALLAAADVAVVKPGNNALSEALAGSANLVLVPDVSFTEGLDQHAASIAASYGGAVGTPDRFSLEPLIRDALGRPPRDKHDVPALDAINAVVGEIHDLANRGGPRLEGSNVAPKALLLVLVAPDHLTPDALSADLPERLRDAVVLGAAHGYGAAVRVGGRFDQAIGNGEAVIVDGEPDGLPPQELADRGVRLLVLRRDSPAVDRWLTLHPPRPALLKVSAEELAARPNKPEAVHRRLSRLLRWRTSAVFVLDLGALPPGAVAPYLDSVSRWMMMQPLRLASVRDIATEYANRVLEGSTR